MDFNTLSAILGGAWLIHPAYARAQMRTIAQELKTRAQAYDLTSAYKNRLETLPTQYFNPKQRNFTGLKSDVYSVSPYTSTERLPYNSIAMVDIIGPVLKYGDSCTYGTVEYNDLVNRLTASNRVSGILMNFDGPGGQADGTPMLSQTIRAASAIKPVVGIVQNGIAASATYWLACACQELYVTQATDKVGSIGAYQTLLDFAGYLEQLGVKEIDIYAPQSVDKNKGYRDALAGDTSLIEADLKALVDDFISGVKANRGGRLNTKTENPFTGKMYNAADAKKIGLHDGVSTITQVVGRLQNLIDLRQAA